jgi:hypothetical protein
VHGDLLVVVLGVINFASGKNIKKLSYGRNICYLIAIEQLFRSISDEPSMDAERNRLAELPLAPRVDV